MASMKLATVSILALATLAGPAAALNLPFGLGGSGDRAPVVSQEPAPVLMAQASDGGVRISQMEEEMRRLTGKVEELSFLVLQLQEQLRKSQEDNEFRFQDLEGKGSGSAAKPAERRTEITPAVPTGGDRVASAAPPSANDATAPASAAPQTDEIGALLGDTSLNEPAAPATPLPGSSQVASIATNGPVEMYSLGYNYMLAGDYQLAENTFRQYTQTYPSSQDAADAQYWLGEALYAQKKYRDAAEVFLNAQKAHPKSGKAPEMMLKLGMSLARLNNRETACVTYAEVGKRYPEMSSNVKRKLEGEEKAANCA
ncbi:tol-pal system protein YbgF [Aureimonas sp. SK2]|uniref:tol-pal system protein YbgF n=1 Tax=Aureimonas sp. SK2 TaxID=3015992 RepID=UPI002443D356|nr:tol-pal system protein YbgF [Aureimonas sp. SK2]